MPNVRQSETCHFSFEALQGFDFRESSQSILNYCLARYYTIFEADLMTEVRNHREFTVLMNLPTPTTAEKVKALTTEDELCQNLLPDGAVVDEFPAADAAAEYNDYDEDSDSAEPKTC